MKYCENCGKKNDDTNEMCINCSGLIFVRTNPQINHKPSMVISIICFFLPLIGLIIVTFSENDRNRKQYRNCSLFGILFYFILALINRYIAEQNYNRVINQMIEEIFK